MKKIKSFNKYIMANVVKYRGCWLWQKSLSSSGYGQIMINSKRWNAHRLAYTLVHGKIPKGFVVRHKCSVTACCNPSHIILGTSAANWKDSERIHRAVHKRNSFIWKVGGKTYLGLRAVITATGLSNCTIYRFSKNNVFNVEEYRKRCKEAGFKPKI